MMKGTICLGLLACILIASPASAKDKTPRKNIKDLSITKRMDKASAEAKPAPTPPPYPRPIPIPYPNTNTKAVRGSVLNGKALKVKPNYPPIAH